MEMSNYDPHIELVQDEQIIPTTRCPQCKELYAGHSSCPRCPEILKELTSTFREENAKLSQLIAEKNALDGVHPDHPSYYNTTEGKDLYSLFEEHYGPESLAKHLEMECLQYLWRCRAKGQYKSDIEKVIVIAQRLLRLQEGA